MPSRAKNTSTKRKTTRKKTTAKKSTTKKKTSTKTKKTVKKKTTAKKSTTKKKTSAKKKEVNVPSIPVSGKSIERLFDTFLDEIDARQTSCRNKLVELKLDKIQSVKFLDEPPFFTIKKIIQRKQREEKDPKKAKADAERMRPLTAKKKQGIAFEKKVAENLPEYNKGFNWTHAQWLEIQDIYGHRYFGQIDLYGVEQGTFTREQRKNGKGQRIVIVECKLTLSTSARDRAVQQLTIYKALLQHLYPKANIETYIVAKNAEVDANDHGIPIFTDIKNKQFHSFVWAI